MVQDIMREIGYRRQEYPPVTDELLQEIVRRIRSVGSPLKIVFFGSRARGNAKPDSDLDIMVIEKPGSDCSDLVRKYDRAIDHVFPEVNLFVYPLERFEEWRDVPNHLITETLTKGKILYEDMAQLATMYSVYDSDTSKLGVCLVCENVERKTVVDLTRDWLISGDKDLKNCRLAIPDSSLYTIVCFHAQQAIEKYLKAFLTFRGQFFEKTHELPLLHLQCQQFVKLPALPTVDSHEKLETIEKYAISGRYDFNFHPTKEQAQKGHKHSRANTRNNAL